MEIGLTVTIDLTPRLERALAMLLGERGMLGIGSRFDGQQPKAQEQQPKAQEQQPKAQEQQSKAQGQQPKAQEQQPKTQETPSAIADVDLRRAMSECRKRIIGPDPATDPLMKKAVNDALRDKVAAMGYTASTDIPQERRAEFVAFCRTLTLSGAAADGDGELPF